MKKIIKMTSFIMMVATCFLLFGCGKEVEESIDLTHAEGNIETNTEKSKEQNKSSIDKTLENTNTYSVIEKLVVDYEKDSETFRRIEIDFISKQKVQIDYIEDTKYEESFSVDNSDELLQYIKLEVLPVLIKTEKIKENASEEKMLWKVQVHTDTQDFNMYGMKNEDYPVFWDKLLEELRLV